MDSSDFRIFRIELRMTQVEMKDALNSSLGMNYDKFRISRWENGKDPIPQEVANAVMQLIEIRKNKARILAFANQKGGVGKTTSAMNIAAALKKTGLKVLLVDIDPQASASDWLLGKKSLEYYRQGKSIYHVILQDADIKDCIVSSDHKDDSLTQSLDIIPSHINLAEADSRREPGFEHALAEALEKVLDDYNFIVIDAPPNLGLMTYMALVAADMVLIPVQTEPPDAMGVALLLDTVQKIQRRLNPHLRVGGILPTRYNARQSVDREVLHHLIQYTAGRAAVLEPISESAVFGNAAWGGVIAVDASPRAKAVLPYLRIASALAKGEVPPLALLNLDNQE